MTNITIPGNIDDKRTLLLFLSQLLGIINKLELRIKTLEKGVKDGNNN